MVHNLQAGSPPRYAPWRWFFQQYKHHLPIQNIIQLVSDYRFLLHQYSPNHFQHFKPGKSERQLTDFFQMTSCLPKPSKTCGTTLWAPLVQVMMVGMASQRLVDLLQKGQFCDVTVVCHGANGPQKLPMSRLVLAAFCPEVIRAKEETHEIELQASDGKTRGNHVTWNEDGKMEFHSNITFLCRLSQIWMSSSVFWCRLPRPWLWRCRPKLFGLCWRRVSGCRSAMT